MLREIVQDKLYILLILEIKVYPSFLSCQFLIEDFSSPFRLDRNSSGSGIVLFVREEIPSKLLSEYNPNLTLLSNHIQTISRGLGFYSSKYGNFIVLRNLLIMLKLQIPLSLSFAQNRILKILLRNLHVLKVWKMQLVLILSWQMFLKPGYPISINWLYCSESLLSESKTKGNQI